MDRRVWLLLALAVIGCGGRLRGSLTRGPDRRGMARLQQQAQRDMHCQEAMHVVTLDVRAYQVDGCGQLREYAWTCAGRRCSFQPMVPAILRASEDLQCAPEQLTAQGADPTHRAFFGCMRGAAYALLCVDRGCTWSRTPETVTIAGQGVPMTASVAAVPLAPPVADPALDAVVIPPPPGAPSAFASSAQADPVPPPPADSAVAPAAPADTVVIPPPPP